MSIFDEIKNTKQYNPNNSASWFKKNVTNTFKTLGVQKFLGDHQAQQTTNIQPGNMYFFGYSPKFKDTLPFYDTWPLILPFSFDDKHFTALNLHYLSPDKRIIILDKLLEHAKYKDSPEKIKLETSWAMLKGISEHKAIAHSVKKYLRGYVKTRFVSIPIMDWPIAVFLPLQRFQGATDQEVWRKGR